MPKERIFKELKPVVYGLMDNNGNFRTVPIGEWKNGKLGEDRLRLMQTFLRLLFETDIICKESKLYISDINMTIKSVNFLMQDACDKEGKVFNYKTTANKIYYDQKKLVEMFGDSLVYDIMHTNNPLDKHIKAIGMAFNSDGAGEDVRQLLCLPLDKSIIASECSRDKFEEFLVSIAPYTKQSIDFINEHLSKEAVGYFNYLVSAPYLSDLDQSNKDLLLQVLNKGYTSDSESNVD